MSASDDARWMAGAIALSMRGRGRTAPNPNVGCLIVSDDRVIGRGWTQPGGRPHAEAMALAQAGPAAEDATVYVTLEPCAHQSPRGPACVDLLLKARPARVVAALTDPDPRTAGAGFARLREVGIEVVEGVDAAGAARAMAGFLTRQMFGRPHVTLKLAMSLDGGIAMANGRSRWITGPEARAHAHLERALADLIVVGRGTLEYDKPTLNVRLRGLEDRAPTPVLLSMNEADVPIGWLHIGVPSDISWLTGDYLLVEGGAETAASFLSADYVDRLLLYRAPILIGNARLLPGFGLSELQDAHDRWMIVDSRTLGSDRLEIYERRR